MFSLSLSLTQSNPKASTPPPPSGTVSLAAFSRDKTLFDSGAGFGRAVAQVPLSGAGTAGEVVQARAVSLDDGGATTTAWADVATIDGAGSWAGNLTAPRSGSWFRPQVRLKASPGVAAQGANRFGVGHVIAIWGQSEPDRIISAFYDNTAAPPIADDEAVQIILGAATTPARHFVTTAQPFTATAAAMASSLIATRPGEKFAVIFHTVPGTDVRSLVNDSDTSRLWSKDKALHDFATADGQKVGFAAMSWFAAPGSLGGNYGSALYPLFSGLRLDGSPVTFPATIPTGVSSTYTADHWFGELYDYANTKWVAYGPHRFDIDADMLDATHLLGGATQFTLNNKQDARVSWRSMLTVPTASMFLPLGLEPTNYVNGVDDGLGSWTDTPHPASNTVDGAQAYARLTGLAVLEAAGLTSWSAPEFDNCLWDPSGAYVEVWSSAGPITTTRLARSEAALPPTFPHWTQVHGFQINGVPAQNATIVAGRVRITPNGGGTFIFSDVINFGEGGATGQIKFPQDLQNATWKNLPIVDVGAAGVDGIALRPIPNAALLANTLPAASNFSTVAGQLTRFKEPVNWPTVNGKITIAVDLLVASTATSNYLFEMDNVHVSCQVAPNSNLFLTIKDSAGTAIFGSASIGAVTAGIRFELIVAADLSTNGLWTTLNGVTTTRTLAANTGILASGGRKLAILSRSSGTSGNTIGTVYKAEVWNECISGGGKPPTDALLRANGRISGPPSVANAHPWKLGGNTV
jgi:hypothetical protein